MFLCYLKPCSQYKTSNCHPFILTKIKGLEYSLALGLMRAAASISFTKASAASFWWWGYLYISPFLVTYITCSLKFASIFPDPFIHSYPKITSALPIQTNKNIFLHLILLAHPEVQLMMLGLKFLRVAGLVMQLEDHMEGMISYIKFSFLLSATFVSCNVTTMLFVDKFIYLFSVVGSTGIVTFFV